MIVYLIIVYKAYNALRLSCPDCSISENQTKIKETKNKEPRDVNYLPSKDLVTLMIFMTLNIKLPSSIFHTYFTTMQL